MNIRYSPNRQSICSELTTYLKIIYNLYRELLRQRMISLFLENRISQYFEKSVSLLKKYPLNSFYKAIK